MCNTIIQDVPVIIQYVPVDYRRIYNFEIILKAFRTDILLWFQSLSLSHDG